MKILDIQQGTDEWKDLRKQYFTASEASIMMGESKTSRNDLLYLKYSGEDQAFSAWMENVLFDRGHEIEKLARSKAEEIIGEPLYPSVGISDDDRFLASFDGITINQDIIWECKQWNEDKAKVVENGHIPESDLWQVVQQLLVSGANKCLYMITNGSDKTVYCWYEYDEFKETHLLIHWNQFELDLKDYRPKDTTQTIGQAPETLPLLNIEVTGLVKSSNLDAFKDKATTILNKINTDLQTDSDFANAEKTVKWCKDIEDRLEFAKEQALSQTSSIDELFKTIDSIKEQARKKRLELDRLVTQRKKSIRTEIAESAEKEIYRHLELLNKTLRYVYIPFECPDFYSAMKGKKTIKSLHDSVDDLLAKTKIKITMLADEIRVNLKSYEEIGKAYDFLFYDLQNLIIEPNENFKSILHGRILIYQKNGQQHVKELKNALKPTGLEEIRQVNKPSDNKIINVLCEYFEVTELTVKIWLSQMNFERVYENAKR